MSNKIFAQPWKHFAETWAKLDVGNHPSPKDIAAYEELMFKGIGDVTKPRVALFGSTPEIRDMLARHSSIEIVVLDINNEMITAMSSLMQKKTTREKHVEGDWLDAPLPNNSFDVVLGDQIRCNVSHADQDKLYQNIHRVLKPGGHHISRITAHFPGTKIYKVEEIIEYFSKQPVTKRTVTVLSNRLTFLTHKNLESTSDRMLDILEENIDKPNMKEYYNQIKEIWPRGKTWNIGRGWESHQKVVGKYFDIEEKRQDDTFFSDSTYIFLLKSKAV